MIKNENGRIIAIFNPSRMSSETTSRDVKYPMIIFLVPLLCNKIKCIILDFKM